MAPLALSLSASDFVLTVSLWRRDLCYPHMTDGEAEAQRGEAALPGLCLWPEAEPGSGLRSPGPSFPAGHRPACLSPSVSLH